MKRIFLLVFLISLVACKKEYRSIYSYADRTNSANVKFIHALHNAFTTPASTTQAGLQVYLNDTKITGTNITYGGGVFPGLEYSNIQAGNGTLKATIPAGSSNAEIPVLSAPVNFEAGKTYSVFITDTLPTTSLFSIEENFSLKADSGKYFVRLVNLTPKTTAYDLYGVTDAVMTIPNVTYKTASPFTQVFAGSGARTFAIRKPGSTTNIATVAITPVAGRMYTVLSYGIDGTTGARAPKLTFFTSRFQQ